ncbi:GNAT family protein [Pedococcus aerophilus]|uniref:GNAT family protein n=1 Tax=Pedococcus aerophilus TaxID=436356 RepID=A0ABN3UW64_9MICO
MADRAATFAQKPILTGEKVVLRPFEDGDLAALAEAVGDPEVGRLTGSFHSSADAAEPPDPDVLRDWYSTRNQQTDRLDLAVVDRATGRCVGEVVLNEWEQDDASANFRILLGPPGRDRGLGTEATRLVLAHAFDRLGLHRVSLEVFSFNPRARRAYEKVGFVVEGTRRDALRFDGRWVDSVLMAVLEDEWRRHRGHPETAPPGPSAT